MNRIWLVEIRVKDWVADLKDGGRVITYEEVQGAGDDYEARHMGFDQFVQRSSEFLSQHRLTLADCCAPSAVELYGSLGGE